MENSEDLFKAMNASTILAAILTKLGSVEIPTQMFMDVTNTDKQLSVTYNDENLSFEFKLMESDKEADELDNN